MTADNTRALSRLNLSVVSFSFIARVSCL